METVNEIPRMDGRMRYDWELMLDGRIWKLVRGEDFDCRVKSVRTACLAYANRRNLPVKIKMVGEDEVYIQFTGKADHDELDEIVA